MTVYLDGRQMTSRTALHDHLQRVLNLPDHYGRNLDALYDLLTERAEPTTLVLEHWPPAAEALGRYGTAFLKTLRDASEKNETLKLEA